MGTHPDCLCFQAYLEFPSGCCWSDWSCSVLVFWNSSALACSPAWEGDSTFSLGCMQSGSHEIFGFKQNFPVMFLTKQKLCAVFTKSCSFPLTWTRQSVLRENSVAPELLYQFNCWTGAKSTRLHKTGCLAFSTPENCQRRYSCTTQVRKQFPKTGAPRQLYRGINPAKHSGTYFWNRIVLKY